LIEAASNGAQQSIKLVADIGLTITAFIALLQFVNATLTWFGQRAGLEPPEYEYRLCLSPEETFFLHRKRK
jgi:pyrimidine nucleoside transport protein